MAAGDKYLKCDRLYSLEQTIRSMIIEDNNGGPMFRTATETPPPTSSNATVQSWLDKIGLDGFTYPSQAQVDVYTAAFDYADAQGLTPKFDILGLAKVSNVNLAKVPFIHVKGLAARFIIGGVYVFTDNVGLSFNTTDVGTDNLSFDYTPSLDAVNYLQGNGCAGLKLSGLNIGQAANMFANSGTNTLELYIAQDNGDGTHSRGGFIQSPGSSVLVIESASSSGYSAGFAVIKVNGGNISYVLNGAEVVSDVHADPQLEDSNISISTTSTNNIQFWFVAKGDIDQAKLNTFMNMLIA